MESILVWTVLGLIAGVLAKMIMPGRQGGGIVMTIILGILGSIVGGWLGSMFGLGTTLPGDHRHWLGGWLGSMFGLGTTGAITLGGIVTAVIGALVLLFLWGVITKQKSA